MSEGRENGIRKWECGSRNRKAKIGEFGSGTRRHPIRQDYTAAKDADVGMNAAGVTANRLEWMIFPGNR